ncbi:MAG: hypothetical protein U0516_01770 [Candidatus Saccharibacteria bacterium]
MTGISTLNTWDETSTRRVLRISLKIPLRDTETLDSYVRLVQKHGGIEDIYKNRNDRARDLIEYLYRFTGNDTIASRRHKLADRWNVNLGRVKEIEKFALGWLKRRVKALPD